MKLLVHHNHHHCARGHHVSSKKHHRGKKDRSGTRSRTRSRSRSRDRSHSRTRRHHRKSHRSSRMDHFHGKCNGKKHDSSSSSSSSDSSSRSPTPVQHFYGQRHGCRLKSHFRARNVYHWHPGHAKCPGCPRYEDKQARGKSSPKDGNPDLVDLTAEEICEQEKEDDSQEVETSAVGPEIDGVLANAWTDIARKGLPAEIKKFLLEKHLISQNCPSLVGPQLNAEISAISKNSVVEKDEAKAKVQNQLGAGLSALGQAITTLNNFKEREIVGVMDTLNEAALIIIDAHHDLTEARRELVTKKITEEVGNIIQNLQSSDELLFGNNIGEKLPDNSLEKYKKKKQRNLEHQDIQVRGTCNEINSDGGKRASNYKCNQCKR